MKKAILHQGFQQPTIKQKKHLERVKFNDWWSGLDDPLLGFPILGAIDEALLCHFKSVEAHKDQNITRGLGPVLSVLWVTHGGPITLHVADESITLGVGDYVVFKDSLMHSVYAEKRWRGFAVQASQSKIMRLL